MSIKKCLIINWTDLPRDLKDRSCEWQGFSNDVLMEVPSEWNMQWKKLTNANIEKYHRDQQANNNFTGNLAGFIEQYSLHFDVWLVENYARELKEVDRVLIDVCW